MRLLLDTHIWLWLTIDPGRLRKHTSAILKDQANELWLSPINTWEALTLHWKRRIFLSDQLRDWVAVATKGLKEAPVTHEIMIEARQFELHQDPADRILAATAKVLDLTLVTADTRLLGLGSIRTLNNY